MGKSSTNSHREPPASNCSSPQTSRAANQQQPDGGARSSPSSPSRGIFQPPQSTAVALDEELFPTPGCQAGCLAPGQPRSLPLGGISLPRLLPKAGDNPRFLPRSGTVWGPCQTLWYDRAGTETSAGRWQQDSPA